MGAPTGTGVQNTQVFAKWQAARNSSDSHRRLRTVEVTPDDVVEYWMFLANRSTAVDDTILHHSDEKPLMFCGATLVDANGDAYTYKRARNAVVYGKPLWVKDLEERHDSDWLLGYINAQFYARVFSQFKLPAEMLNAKQPTGECSAQALRAVLGPTSQPLKIKDPKVAAAVFSDISRNKAKDKEQDAMSKEAFMDARRSKPPAPRDEKKAATASEMVTPYKGSELVLPYSSIMRLREGDRVCLRYPDVGGSRLECVVRCIIRGPDGVQIKLERTGRQAYSYGGGAVYPDMMVTKLYIPRSEIAPNLEARSLDEFIDFAVRPYPAKSQIPADPALLEVKPHQNYRPCPREGCTGQISKDVSGRDERCPICWYPGLRPAGPIPPQGIESPVASFGSKPVDHRRRTRADNDGDPLKTALPLPTHESNLTLQEQAIREPYRGPLFTDPRFCWTCGHNRGCMHPRKPVSCTMLNEKMAKLLYWPDFRAEYACDVRRALYEILGMPVVRHTKMGMPATDKDTLNQLREHKKATAEVKSFIDLFLAYRALRLKRIKQGKEA